ncbi:MAG: DNA polymerase I [Deltaproteobacteria bacterium]|nr:DNA polymerase I [Deltaproteobacteria bacterium]
MTPSTLCLIDGSSQFYRAFFAIRPLTTSKGLHVNAVYGFTTMLLKVLKDLKPDYVSIVFDSAKKTFRHDLYSDYKANRAEMPDDLVEQIPYIKTVVGGFNILALEKEGYEADDIIGTVCQRFKKEGLDIVIISSDKDLMQLIDPHVMLYDTMRDRKIKEPEVKEKFGVTPDRVIDVLGLMGDSSDHVPGVPGIGPKTAAELIQKFGSMEAVLKNTEKLEGKKKEMLEKFKDQALLSKKLVTLDCDVPIQFSLKDFKTQPFNQDALVSLFSELEFQKLLNELGLKSQEFKKKSSLERNYKTIATQKDFDELLKKLSSVSYFVFDTETTSLNPRKAQVVGLSFAYAVGDKAHEACYLPIGHKEGTQLEAKKVLEKLKPLFESSQIQKGGQNIKYDTLVLAAQGIEVSGIAHDSMIASYLLNPSEPHNMDALSLKYLEHQTISYEEVTMKDKKQVTFDYVPIEIATQYSGEDSDVTYRLIELLGKKLKEEKRLSLYEEIEMPLVSILAHMEQDGVKVDIPFLKSMSEELGRDIQSFEQEIYKIAGEEFNIQSPKQLGQILFEKLKLPTKRKTKGGAFSTNVEVLTELADPTRGEVHPLPAKILSYRELAKLKSTYVDALIEIADSKTNRVHTSYNQTIAETGRLSSSDPNLQNIPIRSDLGQKLRKAFIAESGCELLSSDYSQVELRLLAHLSQDEALVSAFKANQDIHAQTSQEVFGVGGREVTLEMRRMAKAINFGLIYGLSAYGLSQQLKISVSQAQEYMERYFSRYPKVKEYIGKTIQEAKEKGYVDTMLGRRRYLPDLKSANPQLRGMAERMAMNTPIQGSAADLIKKAMIQISKRLISQKLKTKMILQVHDELVFEVPKKEMDDVKQLVQEEMEGAFTLCVPIKVDMHSGKTWGDAH